MDILTYALAKSYTDKALLGVGTIKGAPCTVKSQTEDDEYVYVTLGWENSLGTSEETVVKIKKGADGAPGEPGPAGDPGPQGVSITKIEKIKTEDLIDTYQISFSDNTTFEYTISNGSTDYLKITNKPSIEGVELTGNKTFEDLNIASADALTATDENLQNLSNLIGDKTSLPAPTDTIVNNIASVDAKVDAIIDDNEAGLAKTFSSDKITKTFATIEEANKRIPQYDVLPAPTEAFSGKIVQFIGTTTEDYVHNYFYECVEVESSYKWVNVVVQNVPTKVSELTNDSNFVTETELNEKGYLTEHQDISNKVDKVEGKSLIADTEITRLASVDNYDDTDIKAEIAKKADTTAVPNKVSELTNDSNYQTAEQVSNTVTTEIAKVVADAPESLNTLKEMSDWIAGHEDDASAMNSAISDNKTAITALQTGKADKSEIPTTLPANGGNADTVNNHTVETDVPTDAKFTDTVYDDTEVKESIEKLNSNLDTLEYSEVAGGNNIFKANKNGYYDPSGNILKSEQYVCSDIIPYEESVIYVSLDKIYSELNDGNGAWIGFVLFDADKNYIENSYSSTYQRGRLKYSITVNSGTKYVAISKSKDANVCISSKDIDYEHYIPSVKMLADENAQQSTEAMDLKMLGWSVPRECPVQNYVDSDGVFHQRVGRVDLGTLDWSYSSEYKRFSTSGITDYKKKDSSANDWVANAFLKGYSTVSGNDTASDSYNKSIGFNGHNDMFFVKNTSYTDATTFKNAMQGQYLYYELATPVTRTIDGNEAVTKLKNDLDTLELSDVAGGKNIAHDVICVPQTGNWKNLATGYAKLIQGIEYTMSFTVTSNGSGKIYIPSSGGFESDNPVIIINSGTTKITRTAHAIGNDGITKSVFVSTYEGNSATISITDFMIEEGTTATSFEPYIPSVKMLADKVNQQNESLDQLKNDLDGLEYSEVAGGKNILDINKVLEWINKYTNGTYSNDILTISPINNYLFTNPFQFSDVDIDVTLSVESFNFAGGSNARISLLNSNNISVGDIYSGMTTISAKASKIRIDYSTLPTSITLDKLMLQLGTTATPYESYIPSVKMLAEEVNQQNESLGVIGKCKNLLNPTLQTTTQNGVTCTNNGDGTYTLNGTASGLTTFILRDMKLDSSLSYKLTGCPLGGDWDNGYSMYVEKQYWGIDVGKGYEITLTDASNLCGFYIRINKDTVCNNLVFKPMLTTNLNASYDDFVPYTGDGDTLTHDVAEINNDLDKLNLLPKGFIIQIDADKDDIETTKQKYGWQYLGTSNIEYESGSANILVTNVYRKNN